MINVRGLQRNVKNVVKNYTEAQVKVREATSNDPWGPPSTLMAEIAELTNNVVAFSEIMQMIWKRLNDHGKNWRHVYKALSLLDYLIKTGSEKVAQQCKDNIFAIKTLKDFQYFEDNKDQGLNVREKSKALVTLLSDDEKLRTERARALKAKERFAQSVSYISSSASMETIPKTSSSYHETLDASSDNAASGAAAVAAGGGGGAAAAAAAAVGATASRSAAGSVSSTGPVNTELEQARPQTLGEEELHLRLALAMSKEEAEAEERQRKNDDLRLQLALSESEKEKQKKKASALDDLLSIDLAQPSTSAAGSANAQLDIWGSPISYANADTSSSVASASNSGGLELFGAVGGVSGGVNMASNDPWSAPSSTSHHPPLTGAGSTASSQSSRSGNALASVLGGDSSDIWSSPGTTQKPEVANNDPWQATSHSNSSTPAANDPWSAPSKSQNSSPQPNGLLLSRKTPESFLGPNSNLVNLDALVNTKSAVASALPLGGNPFVSSVTSNPFQAAKPAPPTINQLRSQTNFPLDPIGSSSVGSFNSSINSHSTSATIAAVPVATQQPPLNPLIFSQPVTLGQPTLTSPNNPFAM